jgi:hypothetical protein
MSDIPVFVAETGEQGQVICVWRADRNFRGAKPIRRPARHMPDVIKREASFHGASKADIIGWIRLQAEFPSSI